LGWSGGECVGWSGVVWGVVGWGGCMRWVRGMFWLGVGWGGVEFGVVGLFGVQWDSVGRGRVVSWDVLG
jgi:hypothetical protein